MAVSFISWIVAGLLYYIAFYNIAYGIAELGLFLFCAASIVVLLFSCPSCVIFDDDVEEDVDEDDDREYDFIDYM